MYVWEVGKTKLEQYANMDDGYFLEYDNTDGLKLYAFLNNPSVYEKSCITDATIRGMRFKIAFTEIEGVGFMTFRFGDIWGDCVFEPRLHGQDLDFPLLTEEKGLSLLVVLVNPAKGGVIEGMRFIGLGNEFSRKLIEWSERVAKEPLDKIAQMETVKKVFAMYDSEALLKHSMFSWEMK